MLDKRTIIKTFSSILVAVLGFYNLSVYGQESTKMVKIQGGDYVPLYGLDSSMVHIESFMMDQYPVTFEQYREFVIKNEKWRKSKTIKLFADKNYLSQWPNDTTIPSHANPQSPVNSISWFAAKAYCSSQRKRLPKIDEWEYVAMADETRKDARTDSLYNQKILSGYETPKTNLKLIGKGTPNIYGVHDLHGLVWEWTLDFNSVLVSGESRKDVDTDRNLFCAGGAVNATDLMNYAAFMRYAFRGSLKANYSVRNQGFRCVSDLKK